MSTDWFMISPSAKRRVMVGSVGLGGVKVWPTEYGFAEFLRWAIDEHITDIVLVNEHDPRLEEIEDAEERSPVVRTSSE